MPCYPWGSVPQGDKATTMDEILQKYLDKAPAAVIVGATIARTIGDSTLDDIFERHAGAQYTRDLTFSALSRLMTQVVFCTYPSVNAAYQQNQEISVSIASVYNKLNGLETGVSQALAAETARSMDEILTALPDPPDEPVKGLRLRTLDGNFLAGTDHRLACLRGCGAAALPGMTLVVRDGCTGLLTDIVPCEDAYTNARRASLGCDAGPDARRLQPAGHRLVLPAGHPGELPGRQRPRGDVRGGRAAGLGDRGVGLGLGQARLCLSERRPLARGRRRGAGHRDRRQGGPHGHGAGTGAAPRPTGSSQTRLPVSAASGPGETGASGPEEAAEEGGQEQERPERDTGGDVYTPAGRGRSAARPAQQEGVRDVRFAEIGAGMGPDPGDASRLPPQDRQDGADRRRRRDVPGAAAAAAVPRRDPDAGHPACAGEALGGGSAVPPGGERGVDALGRGVGRVALQRACAGVRTGDSITSRPA